MAEKKEWVIAKEIVEYLIVGEIESEVIAEKTEL